MSGATWSPIRVVLNRAPRWCAPARTGWIYVELEYDVEFIDHKCTTVYRGWVRPSSMGSRHFIDWVSHELLDKLQGMARVQRLRRRRDPSADCTSDFVAAISSAVLLAASA